MRAALKAISYMDLDIRKTYKMTRKLSKMLATLYTAPEDYTIWEHPVEREGYSVPVRIFSPPQPGGEALVFFHGGGWVTGDIDTYSRTCVDMCSQTGRIVIAVDYRLSPEYRFPVALEDCYAVLREIYGGHFEGILPEDITLLGDSAGGNLAAAVSLMARDRGEFLPRRQILIYPATSSDHSEGSPYPSVRENGTEYLLTARRVSDYLELYQSSPDDLQNPYFSPILAEDLTNQPETLMITAEFCPLRDEGEHYAARLREAGNRVELYRVRDALHGFFTLPPSFSHVSEVYSVINRFLGKDV
jgi:acetyl esterase/lipase